MKFQGKEVKKIEFAPGCFDEFEGTQEELNDLIAQIHQIFESGEAELLAQPVDIDELIAEGRDDEAEHLLAVINGTNNRTLQ